MNSAIITAIDIGTTKIAVLIGRRDKDKNLELLGLGNVPFDPGDRAGWHSQNSIRNNIQGVIREPLIEAIKQAEEMANLSIKFCTLGIPNEFCGLIRNKKFIPLSGQVTQEDIDELYELVKAYDLPAPWRIHSMLGNFIVDGCYMGNPLGMDSDSLGLEASMICINTDFSVYITELLLSLDISVSRLIPIPLAYGDSLLTNMEKQDSILIDVGGISTDFAVFKAGVPIYMDWLPVGGNNITKDIAAGAKVSLAEADKLKKYCVLGLASTGETSIQDIPSEFLQEIVEARIEEILLLVKDRVSKEDLATEKTTVVFAGGGIALQRGIRSFSSNILGMPVRLAVPDVIGLSSPTLSSAYSILASNKGEDRSIGNNFKGYITRLINFIKNKLKFK